MIELRTLVHSFLKTLHSNVYFLRAPKNAPTPYLVYSLEIRSESEFTQFVLLDIDGWDIGNDSSNLETLMATINSSLDKKTLMTAENIAVSFYLDRKIPMVDDDPQILRRMYMYQGKLFIRE
jgi:hypothetical protein